MDWDEVFAGFSASVDWPSAHFYAQLASHFPEAKVILSLRDPERWYESMAETILMSMAQMGFDKPVPSDHLMRFLGKIVPEATFGCDFSKDNVIAAFERHNAEVRRLIPAERLLVFEAAHGWEPLCAFLDVPVPDDPFPRVNSREEFWDHVKANKPD